MYVDPSSPPVSVIDEVFQIDVKSAVDIQRAYDFSAKTGIPLSVKNSGHDYKGRSSLKGSLALWVWRHCPICERSSDQIFYHFG